MSTSDAYYKRHSVVANKQKESPLAHATRVAINQERNRIARDLHDGVVQQITYVLHKLELIQYYLEQQQEPSALSETKHAYTVLEASLQDLRHGISSLIPSQLEKREFTSALETAINDYRYNHPNVELHCEMSGPHTLPKGLEVPVFRLIQEALTNIGKHAQATRVTIDIRTLPTLLTIEVHDNGIGFRPDTIEADGSSAAQPLGLRAMRERIQEAGGVLEIQSQPAEGTTLRARFPLVNAAVVLTNRERDVLRLIVEGLTNRAIAQRLSIGEATVKTHIHHIMQKMHVKDRTQASIIATHHGLL